MLQSSLPRNIRIITCRWVYKVKPEKLNADDIDTYSATLKMVTLRLLVAIAAFLGWNLWQMDVCNAFLNAELTGAPVYMHCVQGYERPGYVIKLHRALYGLRNSPREWYTTLTDHLIKIGMQQSLLDACLFIKVLNNKVVLIVGLHVDDLIIVGVQDQVDWIRAKMKKEFKMDDLGKPTRVLGIDIEYGASNCTKKATSRSCCSSLTSKKPKQWTLRWTAV